MSGLSQCQIIALSDHVDRMRRARAEAASQEARPVPRRDVAGANPALRSICSSPLVPVARLADVIAIAVAVHRRRRAGAASAAIDREAITALAAVACVLIAEAGEQRPALKARLAELTALGLEDVTPEPLVRPERCPECGATPAQAALRCTRSLASCPFATEADT